MTDPPDDPEARDDNRLPARELAGVMNTGGALARLDT